MENRTRAFVGAALGFAALAGSSFGYLHWRARVRGREEAARIAQAAEDREIRTAAIGPVAPAPLPTSLPLIGPEGRAADGYPTQYVDQPALRSLLWHAKHEALTRYLEQLQAEFERDPTREYWPLDAADAFDSSEPELGARLDAWVAASPQSFAPYLARATHLAAVAQARRGGKWAKDTADEDFAAMREAGDRALADVQRATALRPKLVAARRLQIKLSRLTSKHEDERAALDAALEACPTCFQVRVAYLYSLTPRWGGTYDQMDAFARASAPAGGARMRLLAGYADQDRAQMLRYDKKLDAARVAIERATALGDHWEFLVERANIDLARGDAEHALADLDRAAALRPGHPNVLGRRARAHVNLKRWEAAGIDLLAVMRVDPTDSDARNLHKTVVEGLIYAAWQHHRAGRRTDALRVIDLAAELAPMDHEVQRRRSSIVIGAQDPAPGDEVAALEKAVRDQPDSFRAHQQLDYALARKGQLDRVVALWTEYLGRHPSEGPAYLERGGAYFHQRKLAEAHADAAKACELGVSEGCARAQQLSGMLNRR
jgi:tetratricopeptide (TPR) repeat protein